MCKAPKFYLRPSEARAVHVAVPRATCGDPLVPLSSTKACLAKCVFQAMARLESAFIVMAIDGDHRLRATAQNQEYLRLHLLLSTQEATGPMHRCSTLKERQKKREQPCF